MHSDIVGGHNVSFMFLTVCVHDRGRQKVVPSATSHLEIITILDVSHRVRRGSVFLTGAIDAIYVVSGMGTPWHQMVTYTDVGVLLNSLPFHVTIPSPTSPHSSV